MLEELGGTGQEHYGLVGEMPDAEVDEVIAAPRIPCTEQGTMAPISRIQKSAVHVFGRACRIAVGKELTSEQRASQEQQDRDEQESQGEHRSLAPTATGLDSVKLSQVLDQVSDATVSLVGREIIKNFCTSYRQIFRKDPAEHNDVTEEHIIAVHHKLDADQNPYADFSVWRPFGNRFHRKQKFKGLQLQHNGTFKEVELYGPPTHQEGAMSYELLVTALIGFQAVSLGDLLDYGARIKEFHDQYGPKCRLVIYQADVRCRLEHMGRLKRNLCDDELAAQPWTHVWRKAVADTDFWNRELDKRATLIMAEAASLSGMVAGDAPASSRGDDTVAAPIIANAMGTPRGEAPKRPALPPPGYPRPAKQAKGPKQHTVVNGEYPTNRAGITLCRNFQSNSCDSGIGTICPRDRSRAHQCSKCLSPGHGPSTCALAHREPAGLGRSGKGKAKEKSNM
ncbi:unnamed protein product [Prorocentrum cordatum]|uniref:Uncharacterized protein n=1 Tax=Prorocentrum cordatum TaxID=2364126 RepID=A0ABN9RTV5_9DINO|nr:unnamed protein product [Polarella glacialis]